MESVVSHTLVRSLSLLFVAWLAGNAMARGAETDRPTAANAVQPLPSAHLHNLFRAGTNIFSGSAPLDDAAFAELARLGVKTLVSVDGAVPDAATARKHGLRYIHLPVGYDGVSSNRVAALVKAAGTVPGPIYVHCHHGQHRGPAAVAVICEATDGWTTNQAVCWMREAGTAVEYDGLYRSAVEFRRPDAAALATITEFPEATRTSSLVEAMVALDEEFERLDSARATRWGTIPNQPDLTPGHTATLLWEHLRELARLDEVVKRPADFGSRLSAAEDSALQLRDRLRDSTATPSVRDEAFQSLKSRCADCHRHHRN